MGSSGALTLALDMWDTSDGSPWSSVQRRRQAAGEWAISNRGIPNYDAGRRRSGHGGGRRRRCAIPHRCPQYQPYRQRCGHPHLVQHHHTTPLVGRVWYQRERGDTVVVLVETEMQLVLRHRVSDSIYRPVCELNATIPACRFRLLARVVHDSFDPSPKPML